MFAWGVVPSPPLLAVFTAAKHRITLTRRAHVPHHRPYRPDCATAPVVSKTHSDLQ